MAIGEGYQSDMLDALKAAPYRNPDPPPKKFSLWGAATDTVTAVQAGQRGAGAGAYRGAVEMAAGLTEIVEMASLAGAAYDPASSGGMFAVKSEAEQIEQARARASFQGMDGFRPPIGGAVRDYAAKITPNAKTAHEAERLLFDFTRFAGKAVGYSAMASPFGAAGLLAVDEGLSAAEATRREGLAAGVNVDLATRAKVGAVHGVASGAAILLPVAGKTIPQTLGLVAAGGPGAFVAEQYATREILKDAGYENLSRAYDPSDAFGLALSVIVPGGVAAVALRGARGRAKVQADVAAAERADAEFAQGPIPSQETPTAQASRIAVSAEQYDAAMVSHTMQTARRSNPYPADDWRAHDVHEQAVARAMDQLARGEDVAVRDMLPPIQETPAVTALRSQLDEANAELMGARAGVAQIEPGAKAAEVRAAEKRVSEVEAKIEGLEQKIGESSEFDLFAARMAQVGREIRELAEGPLGRAETRAADGGAAVPRQALDGQPAPVGARGAAPEPVPSRADTQAIKDPAQTSFREAIAKGDAAGAMKALKEIRRAEGRPVTADDVLSAAKNAEQAAGRAGDSGAAQPEIGQPRESGAKKAGAGKPTIQSQAVRGIETTRPDMLVRMDGMDEGIPVKDFMENARALAEQEIDDASLFNAAAECFLSMGG